MQGAERRFRNFLRALPDYPLRELQESDRTDRPTRPTTAEILREMGTGVCIHGFVWGYCCQSPNRC